MAECKAKGTQFDLYLETCAPHDPKNAADHEQIANIVQNDEAQRTHLILQLRARFAAEAYLHNRQNTQIRVHYTDIQISRFLADRGLNEPLIDDPLANAELINLFTLLYPTPQALEKRYWLCVLRPATKGTQSQSSTGNYPQKTANLFENGSNHH